eukprot:CAMPEP_0202093748 /NCGR_PEP_ID=MMETSP0964-20121228/48697_1 /ASSEMBLY_ACC=CAM_ASM_000500 /TAXON_ID=4773 /ORGANISM="Schizochytrium aggregatum, Strain ATCC28209" /LENGTH=100 /DNA_ID=CAMNT_0048661999 /DNA_START=539 /DNA_END=841 /DNA_ORIENTATION=+
MNSDPVPAPQEGRFGEGLAKPCGSFEQVEGSSMHARRPLQLLHLWVILLEGATQNDRNGLLHTVRQNRGRQARNQGQPSTQLLSKPSWLKQSDRRTGRET